MFHARILKGWPPEHHEPVKQRTSVVDNEGRRTHHNYGGHHLWAEITNAQGELNSDCPRQVMEHNPSPLRPAGAVVRQDVAAWRYRTGKLKMTKSAPTSETQINHSSETQINHY